MKNHLQFILTPKTELTQCLYSGITNTSESNSDVDFKIIFFFKIKEIIIFYSVILSK